jgi:hypothetical protein
MLNYADIFKEFKTYTSFFSWQYVNTPNLGAHIAPTSLREQSLAQLKQIPTQGLAPVTVQRLDKLVQQLSTGRFDPKQWKQFKQLTLVLDKIRGESIFEAAPGVAAYLDVVEDC